MTRALIAGAAGFVGSHLTERLLAEGWDVIAVDSLITGDTANLEGMRDETRLVFEERDVLEPLEIAGDLDWVLNLASPASPVDYLEHPLETLRVGSLGTLNLLELARAKGSAFFMASTSEVYGDPLVHPQVEGYWGNVNPVGPRSVYDEAKRFSEAATMAFHRAYALRVRVARIFNTYGERMRRGDGRAVPTFIAQALSGAPITVHGDGSQTRSLCHVSDLVEGIWRLLGSSNTGPMNLGNPNEITVGELARAIVRLAASSSTLSYVERPVDDPEVRRPDITLAQQALGWTPRVDLEEGLAPMITWARGAWFDAADGEGSGARSTGSG